MGTLLLATIAMASALWLRDIPPLPVVLLVAVAGGLLMCVARLRCLGVAVGAACWLLVVADDRLSTRLGGVDTLETTCRGQVIGLPAELAGRLRLLFRIEQCDASEDLVPRGLVARVSWYRSSRAVRPGDHLVLRLALRPPRGRRNPQGFDFDTWLFVRGIGALGTVRAEEGNRALAEHDVTLDRLRWQLRERMRAGTRTLAHGGLIEALVVGSRDRITATQRELLAKTGAAHLVAISGLHIGMVASVGFAIGWGFWWLVTRLGLANSDAVDRRVIASVVGLLCAVVYAALAGFSLPTVRALVMLSVFCVALVLRLPLGAGQSLAMAFACVLAIWPLSLLDAGFWLSFTAVAAITLGIRSRRHWRGVSQGLWVNAVIGLVLTPLTLLVFGDITWLSPFANLLLVPVFAVLIVPCALLATVLLGVAPMLSIWLYWAVDAALAALLFALMYVADNVPLGLPSVMHGPSILALVAVSAWLLLPRGWPLSPLLAAAALLIAFAGSPARPSHGSVRATVLDVGHGLAVVIETATRTLVYDTGPRFGQFDTGAMVVAPVVRAGGRDRVDALVVSHADSDHAGGVPGLLRALPVDRVLRPENGTCAAGVNWQWDGVAFRIEHPQVSFSGSENDQSCVLRVQVPGGQSMLLLGDVERRGEATLVRSKIEPATVILVPHHGSKTSSGDALLAQLRPDIAIASHARGGRFKLPHPSVRDRYRQHGIAWFGTADHGAIQLTLPAERALAEELTLWRRERQRFWHR